MQCFFFFLEDSSIILRIRFVWIVVGDESDDNIYAAYDRGLQNRRFAKSGSKNSRFQRRGPRSSRFTKKGSAKQKVWEPLL